MSLHNRRGALLALALTVIVAMPAAGQEKLAEGTWTGTVEPPNEGIIDIELVVVYGDDGIEIELVPPAELGMGSFAAFDILFDGDALAFTLDVGEVVLCSLVSIDEGAFEGDCTDSSGYPAPMTIFPPGGTR